MMVTDRYTVIRDESGNAVAKFDRPQDWEINLPDGFEINSVGSEELSQISVEWDDRFLP